MDYTPQDDEDEAAENKAADSDTNDDLLETLKGWYKPDNEKFKVWADGIDKTDGGAREDFKFRDGDQ